MLDCLSMPYTLLFLEASNSYSTHSFFLFLILFRLGHRDSIFNFIEPFNVRGCCRYPLHSSQDTWCIPTFKDSDLLFTTPFYTFFFLQSTERTLGLCILLLLPFPQRRQCGLHNIVIPLQYSTFFVTLETLLPTPHPFG